MAKRDTPEQRAERVAHHAESARQDLASGDGAGATRQIRMAGRAARDQPTPLVERTQPHDHRNPMTSDETTPHGRGEQWGDALDRW